MTLDGFVPPLIVIAATLAAILARYAVSFGHRRTDAAAVVALMLLTGWLEQQMGQPLTYRHGPVRVWSGDITSDQNSQQVADPYTFTHVTHGALFYGLTALTMPAGSMGLRLVAAVGAEAAWESYENTPTIIERYRAVTISLGYYGDSVLNSVCDIAACIIGFWLTSRLPAWLTVAWIIAVEVALAFWIRDNLALNILMLVYPMDAIRAWQAGV